MIHAFSSVVCQHQSILHEHDFHEFFFCLCAQKTPDYRQNIEHCESALSDCVHQIEDATIPTSQGDLFFIPSGQHHHARSYDDYLCPCIVLYCTNEELSCVLPGDADVSAILKALEEFAKPGKNRLPLSGKETNRIHNILLDIEKEGARKMPGWRCAQKQLFMAFLLAIFRTWSGREPLQANLERAEPNERINHITRFIETQYMSPIGVEDMLRISCLSRSHFHAVFKKETGHTFKDYLNLVRISNAKKLLQETDMPISQIALSCGFASQSRFNHVFRHIAGLTPGAERHERYG